MSRHSILKGIVAAFLLFGGVFMPIYKNSDMRAAIDEYVHNPKYRELLCLRFCDGFTYEEIAETVNFSPQHVRHICRKYKPLLISAL